jgi:homocysteine S-methyltransferase
VGCCLGSTSQAELGKDPPHVVFGGLGADEQSLTDANASRLSHAELDEATELDRGDIGELAALYDDLRRHLDLRVVGGCCGTDAEHVAAIAGALVSAV